MVAADWNPRLISAVMVLPAALGGFFLAKILILLFRDLPDKERRLYLTLTFLVGIAATGPISLLGSTMNDWPGAALVIVALWLLLRRSQDGNAAWPALLGAGVIVGIASGLKLTNAIYAVGLCASLLAQKPVLPRGLRDAAAFGVATVAGVLVSSGTWMWALYSRFDSPLFPYFNDIIRSQWWDASRIVERRFGPHTLIGWLTFPLPLLQVSPEYLSESTFRDWRMPLVYFALIGALAMWLVRHATGRAGTRSAILQQPKSWRLVLVFCAVSWGVWAYLYSVSRYLMPLELLSGAVLVYLLALSVPRRWLLLVAAIACSLALVTTRYQGWGRIDYGEHFFSIKVPPVAPGALVLLLGDEPLSFVLPSFPADGRFVGAYNNFNDPWRKNRLAEAIIATVRDHRGPLYSLTTPAGANTRTLDAYRLHRMPGGCASLETNMPTVPMELCRLERTGADAQTSPGGTIREPPR
jgi:hypothetical protein